MTYKGIERRRSPRVRDGGIKVEMADRKYKRLGAVLNVSLHGVLVRTKKYFYPEGKIRILLHIPHYKYPISVLGKVVRTVTKLSLKGFLFSEEIGIEFVKMSQLHRDVLKRTLETLL